MQPDRIHITERVKKGNANFGAKRRSSPRDGNFKKVNLVNQMYGIQSAAPNSEKPKYKKKFLSRSLVDRSRAVTPTKSDYN